MPDSFVERIRLRNAGGTDDAPDTWAITLWAWSQYVLYPVIFAVGWLQLGRGWALAWSLPLGFALYGLWMTGHDACHNSMFRARRPWANHLIAFLTLDCLLVTQNTWVVAHHEEHHRFPSSNVDGQRLEGQSVAAELWNVFLLLVKYLWTDFVDCVRAPTPVKVGTQLLRWVFLASLAWKSGGWGLPLTLFVLIVLAAYLGLLSHSVEPLPGAMTFPQKQLSAAADLLPGNWLAEFVTGGLNTHAVHHVWPHLGRGLHGWASRRLRVLEPQFYRSSDTVASCFAFWWNRKNPKPQRELPSPAEFYG